MPHKSLHNLFSFCFAIILTISPGSVNMASRLPSDTTADIKNLAQPIFEEITILESTHDSIVIESTTPAF